MFAAKLNECDALQVYLKAINYRSLSYLAENVLCSVVFCFISNHYAIINHNQSQCGKPLTTCDPSWGCNPKTQSKWLLNDELATGVDVVLSVRVGRHWWDCWHGRRGSFIIGQVWALSRSIKAQSYWNLAALTDIGQSTELNLICWKKSLL